MTASLLTFLEFKDKDLIKTLMKIESENFPPILLLMNLNGTLIHRTDKKVEFAKM